MVGNAGPQQDIMHHYITVVTGEFIVAAYHITLVISLLNLMVSLLIQTADRVLVLTFFIFFIIFILFYFLFLFLFILIL